MYNMNSKMNFFFEKMWKSDGESQSRAGYLWHCQKGYSNIASQIVIVIFNMATNCMFPWCRKDIVRHFLLMVVGVSNVSFEFFYALSNKHSLL